MVIRGHAGLFCRVRSKGSETIAGLVGLLLCRPVAIAGLLVSRLLGWSIGTALIVAAGLNALLPSALTRSATSTARFLVLWTAACRFRRRWPNNLDSAEKALERQVLVRPSDTTVDTAPGRHRHATPHGEPPSLARLPHRIEGTTVAWDLDLGQAGEPERVRRRLQSLSLVDPRILTADIERRPDHPNGWMVVVDFDIVPTPWGLSVLDRRHVFPTTSTDRAAKDTVRDRQEGSGSHGNG